MYELFTKKVRAAAVAGWWTLLIAYCILLIQWLCFWGEGFTWPEIRTIWLWAMVAYKLGVAMMIFVVIWLTLWARQLAKK
jgi:hypothetical protein